MAKNYNKVSRSLWGDAKVTSFGPPPMHPTTLLLYLLTTEMQGHQPGLLRLGVGTIADAGGWDALEVEAAMRVLEASGIVRRSKRPPLLWLPNTARHNAPESPRAAKGWGRYAGSMPECSLLHDAVRATKFSLTGSFARSYAEGWREATGYQEHEHEQEQESKKLAPSKKPKPDSKESKRVAEVYAAYREHAPGSRLTLADPQRSAIAAALKSFRGAEGGADGREPVAICKGIMEWVFKAPGHPEYLRGDNDKGTKYTSVVSIFRAAKCEARRVASREWLDSGATPYREQQRGPGVPTTGPMYLKRTPGYWEE